jgi:hypothetical protein
MRAKNAHRSLAPVALMLGLAACGGGGGGDAASTAPPAGTTIDAGNADAVASRAYQAVTALYDATSVSADQLKSAGAAAGPDLVRIALAQLHAATGLGGAGGRETKAIQTGTLPCGAGGGITATANDVDGDGRIGAGDSVALRFDDCVEQGVTLSGSMSFAVQRLTSTTAANSARATFTFTGFRAQSGSDVATADGDLTLDATISKASPLVSDVSLSGTRLEVSEGAAASTLANYTGRLQEDATARTYSYTVQGQAAGSALPGTLTLSTPTPISGTIGADPVAGVLVVQGANAAQARLTVTPPTGVTIGLDANGDGTLEAQKLLTWAQLDAL